MEAISAMNGIDLHKYAPFIKRELNNIERQLQWQWYVGGVDTHTQRVEFSFLISIGKKLCGLSLAKKNRKEKILGFDLR